MASVFATFSMLKEHVNFKINREIPSTDNIIFKLHYRATFLILLTGSVLVTSRQFFGEHIKCIGDSGVKDDIMNVINTFCFFTSTFTVVKHMNLTSLEQGNIAHPGVGPMTKNDELTYHAYYQWVPFVLFFQALLFYLPHYIWRSKEGGRLRMLVSGLHMASLSINEEQVVCSDNGVTIPSRRDKEKKIYEIRTAFVNRLHMNRPWAYWLGVCEVMNLLNLVFQTYITNEFLGGTFMHLGEDVVETDFNKDMDALDEIFPKVTKCTFHKYGPAGSIQKHDVLCVMALNIINEKIYAFLWFWFIILGILTGLGLIWRILTMLLYSRSHWFNKLVFSMACPGKYNPHDVLKSSYRYSFGDWLFLYYIAKNVENYVFKELLIGLEQDYDERRRSLYSHLSRESYDPLKSKDDSHDEADGKGEDSPSLVVLK